jgi:hypothetical protein
MEFSKIPHATDAWQKEAKDGIEDCQRGKESSRSYKVRIRLLGKGIAWQKTKESKFL